MSERTPYIFISHSSSDADFTEYAAARLEEAGFRTWVDVESISDGSSWPREIQKAVENCGAMLVIMSNAARESEWVERETLLAMSLRKPMFIALIEDTPLPVHLINRQFSDVRKRRDSAMRKLIGVLNKVSLTEPLPELKPREAARLSPRPNEHNLFKYIEQLDDGAESARIARELFAWADEHADAVTFSGRAEPGFNVHVYVGPGGVTVFSVRAYPRQPSVEVPLQYLVNFPPYDDRARRLEVLRALNALMPPDQPFAEDRADRRPNLPLTQALATPRALTTFLALISEIVDNLRAADGER